MKSQPTQPSSPQSLSSDSSSPSQPPSPPTVASQKTASSTMKGSTNLLRQFALPIAWSVMIGVICLAPNNIETPPSPLPLDKVAHFLMFAGFGGLWLHALPKRRLGIAIAGMIFGLATEILQSQMEFGRSGDGLDLLADSIGLGVGLWAGPWLSSQVSFWIDRLLSNSHRGT